jgi:hypothetical protein
MTVARAWYASKERRMSQSLVAQGPLRTVLTTASYQQLMMLDQLDNAKSKMASADSVRETATQMLLVFQDWDVSRGTQMNQLRSAEVNLLQAGITVFQMKKPLVLSITRQLDNVKNQDPNVVSVKETVTQMLPVPRAWYASKEMLMSRSLVAQGPFIPAMTSASYQKLMMLEKLDNAKRNQASADSVRETATQMLIVLKDWDANRMMEPEVSQFHSVEAKLLQAGITVYRISEEILMMLDSNAKSNLFESSDSVRETATQMLLVVQDWNASRGTQMSQFHSVEVNLLQAGITVFQEVKLFSSQKGKPRRTSSKR